jgi:hypothetical protein
MRRILVSFTRMMPCRKPWKERSVITDGLKEVDLETLEREKALDFKELLRLRRPLDPIIMVDTV